MRTLTLSLVLTLVAVAGAGAQSWIEPVAKAAKAAPRDASAQLAYGRALIKAGRFREAEAQMERGAALAKGDVQAQYDVARVKFAEGNYKGARAFCKTLAKDHPKHVLSEVCMARAYLAWRRSSEAFSHIARAEAIDRDNPEVVLARADAHRMAGQFEQARDAYTRLAALVPQGADAHRGLGTLYLSQGRRAEAQAEFAAAIQRDPNDPVSLYELGRLETGARAVELLDRALAVQPSWFEAKLADAEAKLHAGDADGSEALARALLKQRPDDAGATSVLGAALLATGKLSEAESLLRKALELRPNDYDASLGLARVLEGEKRYEEAFAQYRKTAELRLQEAEPFLAAARLGVKLSRPLLAGALLDRALERAPRRAEALALYGDVHRARGEKKLAREYYQRALKGEGAFDRAGVQARLRQLQ